VPPGGLLAAAAAATLLLAPLTALLLLLGQNREGSREAQGAKRSGNVASRQ
jgi:hypothetical protein